MVSYYSQREVQLLACFQKPCMTWQAAFPASCLSFSPWSAMPPLLRSPHGPSNALGRCSLPRGLDVNSFHYLECSSALPPLHLFLNVISASRFSLFTLCPTMKRSLSISLGFEHFDIVRYLSSSLDWLCWGHSSPAQGLTYYRHLINAFWVGEGVSEWRN